MVRSMPITEARDKLTSLHGELEGTGNTIAVTNRCNPVLAVLNWEFYESILETLEIMSDPDLVKSLRKSIEEAKAGNTVSLKDAEKESFVS